MPYLVFQTRLIGSLPAAEASSGGSSMRSAISLPFSPAITSGPAVPVRSSGPSVPPSQPAVAETADTSEKLVHEPPAVKAAVVSADVLFEQHRESLHRQWIAGQSASERRFDEVAVTLARTFALMWA